MVNPPWRLDPLQTIINIHFPDKEKDKDKDKGNSDPSGTPKPGNCPDCGLSGCGLCICCTCYCPGIFCIGAGGCCIPAGCSFAGLLVVPEAGPTYACASRAWVVEQYFNCCSGTSGCQDAAPVSGGSNFFPPGTTPPFALP